MTKQFDVVPHPVVSGRRDKPFLIDVQDSALGHLTTRVTAALVVRSSAGVASRLYPEVIVLGRRLYFDPTDMIALPVRVLGTPVANLKEFRDRIIPALDIVFTGV
jgi:hypothetical protein